MAEKENQNGLQHGGGAARGAISRGTPFTGMAQAREREVIAELAEEGLEEIVERNAIRLQTATDLYYDALIKAANDGNEEKIDSYVRSYGWLAGKTNQAWEAVKKMRVKTGRAIDNVLTAYSEEEKTQQEAPGAPQ